MSITQGLKRCRAYLVASAKCVCQDFIERPVRSWGKVFITLAVLAFTGIWGYALATMPGPAMEMLPMSWQTVAEPVPNVGIDKQGRTLKMFVESGYDARDYHPIESREFRVGDELYVMGYRCFYRKMSHPYIQRWWYEGPEHPEVKVARTVKDGGKSMAPSRTDGCVVRNIASRIPLDLNPPGVSKMVWTYAPQAEFLNTFPKPPDPIFFAPVTVTIVSP